MRQTDTIRELNDQFRRSFIGGRVVMTQGVVSLDEDMQTDLISQVQQFNVPRPHRVAARVTVPQLWHHASSM